MLQEKRKRRRLEEKSEKSSTETDGSTAAPREEDVDIDKAEGPVEGVDDESFFQAPKDDGHSVEDAPHLDEQIDEEPGGVVHGLFGSTVRGARALWASRTRMLPMEAKIGERRLWRARWLYEFQDTSLEKAVNEYNFNYWGGDETKRGARVAYARGARAWQRRRVF